MKLWPVLPGMYPRTVSRMLISTSLSQRSFSAKTPKGGSRTARMILQMSPTVNAIMLGWLGDVGSRQRSASKVFAKLWRDTRSYCHFVALYPKQCFGILQNLFFPNSNLTPRADRHAPRWQLRTPRHRPWHSNSVAEFSACRSGTHLRVCLYYLGVYAS